MHLLQGPQGTPENPMDKQSASLFFKIGAVFRKLLFRLQAVLSGATGMTITPSAKIEILQPYNFARISR